MRHPWRVDLEPAPHLYVGALEGGVYATSPAYRPGATPSYRCPSRSSSIPPTSSSGPPADHRPHTTLLMTRRIGRGGRKGQTHTASPKLRSYSVPPASEVTGAHADGTTEIVPARKPQATQKQRPKRGPLICAMCGAPTTESPTVYSTARGKRGKPLHASSEPSAKRERPKRPPPAAGAGPDVPAAGARTRSSWRGPGDGLGLRLVHAVPGAAGAAVRRPLQRRVERGGQAPASRTVPGGEEGSNAEVR